MRKKLVPEERPICNVVCVYRTRGNYLQRLELFEKAILAYNEALRWNASDVRSLLGRSLARAKATYYNGALDDAARAAELEPENLTALQIRAQTVYEKCSFERALVLASRGQIIRRFPSNFADCARCAEETIRECTGKSAEKVLSSTAKLLRSGLLKEDAIDPDDATETPLRKRRMSPQPTQQVQEISRVEKQKSERISRLMASKYLEQMAHDKHFLTALCKDERLVSANKVGSQKLYELAHKALADVEKRQTVLRERRPLYAARASEAAARARLLKARKERIIHTQKQNKTDAKRLVKAAEDMLNVKDTAKCLELAEFGIEQISRRPANLLPGKEIYLQALHDIVANAFLDQKRVREQMSEADLERRAFVLLGISISREPSRDSVLRFRPPAPPRDAKLRLRALERALSMSGRASERCYVLHELARLHVDTKQGHRARFYATKCQAEARSANQRIWLLNATFLLTRCHLLQNNRPEARAVLIEVLHCQARSANQRTWLLNATFLLARCHLLQNNRPEARAVLIEGAALAHSFRHADVASFFETCVNVSTEGEVDLGEATLEKRERAMVDLMQDDDLKKAAEHLFRRMSIIPAARRFSVMPGTRASNPVPQTSSNRRASIVPRSQQPTMISHKANKTLGFQDFDY